MKKQELTALSKKGAKAIQAEISKLKLELQRFKLEAARAKQKNIKMGKNIRRSIAQLSTMLSITNITKDQS